MKAVDVELGALLTRERRHLIPTYQRDYEWTEEGQWQLLMDDVLDVAASLSSAREAASFNGSNVAEAESAVGPHFLGAIVLEAMPPRGAHVAACAVIDGQQRLTTIFLLLRGLLDVLSSNDAHVRARQVRRMLLVPSDAVLDPEESFKLWPRRRDRDAWQNVMLDECSASTHRYATARRYFADRFEAAIEALGEDDRIAALDTIVDALTLKIKLVVVDLENADDAQLIFEVLNGRQTPLSAADLVKNLLFMRADVTDAALDALYDTYWAPFDDEWWTKDVGRGHASRGRRDQLLATWLTVQTADEVNLGHLYGEARRFLLGTTTKLPEILADIANLAREYRQIYERPGDVPASIAKVYWRMERLGVTTAVPLLAWLRTLPVNRLSTAGHIRAVAAVDSFVMRRLITGWQTRGYGRAFLEVLKRAQSAPPDAAVDETIWHALLSKPYGLDFPTDDEVTDEFSNRTFYGRMSQERIRMILGPIDEWYQRSRRKGEHAIFSYDNLTIEHLLPQQWRTHWPVTATNTLEKAAKEQNRDRHVHRIGNLTLVTEPLNPAMSNAAWVTKRGELAKHSKLELNADLAAFDIWDEVAISLRARTLAEAACQVWARTGPPLP